MSNMSIFKSKYKFPDDEVIVKVTLSRDYEPNKNPAIKEIIEQIDSTETLNLPKIGETYPRLNLAQAQTLFMSIKQLFAVGRNLDVTVEKMAFQQRNEKKKWQDYLEIDNFSIDLDYLNLTVPVVKQFFTAERFENVPYDDKEKAAEDFLKEYSKQTNCKAGDLAIIPTEAQFNDEDFGRINPLVNERIEEQERTEQQRRQTELAKQRQVEEQRKAEAERQRKSQLQTSQGSATNNPKVTTVSEQTFGSRSRLNAGQQASQSNDGVQVVNDGHIFAPQFEIKEYPQSAANPSDDNYVAFMLNEKKKESNEYLRKVAEILNLSTDKDLSKQITLGRNEIEKKVNAYQEDNVNKTVIQGIKDDISSRLNDEKERERVGKVNEIEQVKKQAILEAEKIYKAAKEKAETTAENSTTKLDEELVNKYTDRANVEVKHEIDELNQKTEAQINKIIAAEVRTLNSNLSGEALTIQEKNTEKLNESYKKFSSLFAEYTNTFEQQHSNAVRKQADLKNSQYKLDEAKNNQEKLVDYKNQFEKEHENNLFNQRKVNELQEKINSLVADLKDKDFELTQKKEKKDEFSDFYKVLALQNQAQNNNNHQATSHLAEKKGSGVKWLVGGLVVLLVGTSAGLGTMIYQQNNQKVNSLVRENKQINQKLNETNKKSSAQDKLKEKNNELQKQIDQQKEMNKLLESSITKGQDNK
ncbi:hypothetical protein R4B61_07550 (plasmid) [Fructilactobacillus vespulae]|uniref:hypothetical protein n=1 Tax=Fructilactobacillus vespulae TaxID=1249630 RepID=UPI0039B5B0E4